LKDRMIDKERSQGNKPYLFCKYLIFGFDAYTSFLFKELEALS